MAYIQHGQITSSVPLPPGTGTHAAKTIGEGYRGTLIRGSDSPNNFQMFHIVKLVCDSSQVSASIPVLGTGDGQGFILTDYDVADEGGQISYGTLEYSAESAFTPYPTSTDQASSKQVSIVCWPDFAANCGNGSAPLGGAIFDGNSTTSSFLGFDPTSPFAGNETINIPTVVYTYTEYSTSEFSSDAELCSTIQSPDGSVPSLAGDGNWLLDNSSRGKSGYFYQLQDTYVGSANPGWNTTIYG